MISNATAQRLGALDAGISNFKKRSEQLDKIAKGGPGSGRYPAGSGGHPQTNSAAKAAGFEKTPPSRTASYSDVKNAAEFVAMHPTSGGLHTIAVRSNGSWVHTTGVTNSDRVKVLATGRNAASLATHLGNRFKEKA